MRADGKYLAILYEDYLIHILHCGDAVSDKNGGPSLSLAAQVLEDRALGIGIDCADRVIKYEYRCSPPS